MMADIFVAFLTGLLYSWRQFIRRIFSLPKKTHSRTASPKGGQRGRRMTKSDEFEIVRLHATQLNRPLCKIRDQINAALGTKFSTRSIVRAISRNRKLLERLLDRKPRTISTQRPRELWGIDITEVRVFLVFHIHVLGIIDYFGSKLICLQPLKSLKPESIISILENLFIQHGKPERFISDRGSAFTSKLFREFLNSHGIKHTFIRPAHPWANGRIERLFRTFKTMLTVYSPMVLDNCRIAAFCKDFIVYYNEARPHSAWDGLTPDEVYFRRPRAMHSTPTTFFEGRLEWYRFSQ